MGNPSGHRARKRFGQNFLHDQSVIARIVSAIRPKADDCLVEIGPGLGALTQPLLTAAGCLQVVELDRDLIPLLKASCEPVGELTVHEADALKFDFSTLAESGKPLRVVGNLPYNISTPLLFHLLTFTGLIKDMHFMLQHEVVRRLAAPPGSKEYGRLSVITQYYCKVDYLFSVAGHAFTPAPKVESAIVRMAPYETPPVAVGDVDIFRQIVTASFAHRRKTLRNNLKHLMTAETIAANDIDPGIRAEQLTLAEFAALSRAMQ